MLARLPGLVSFHGARFFYAVSENVLPSSSGGGTNGINNNTPIPGPSISASDRSRLRKNDEIASLLAWKCPKLRRLDHWEDGRDAGKVIVLSRDSVGSSEKVKWEVKRVLRS